jgi:hypothetical protein
LFVCFRACDCARRCVRRGVMAGSVELRRVEQASKYSRLESIGTFGGKNALKK